MRIKGKKEVIVLTLGIFIAVMGIINYSISNDQDLTVENRDESNLKRLKRSVGYTENFIHIDGSIPGNWTGTTGYPWCYIDNGVYIIENVTIDASSSPTNNGILINNSKTEHFIVRNCTIYNGYNGIRLENTDNGTLTKNYCSNNSYGGIRLWDNCRNNTLSGNVVTNNYYGIHLNFNCDHNSIISGNILNKNQVGIYLTESCDDNTISGNIANDNIISGIRSIECNNNILSQNIIVKNAGGLEIYIGNNNIIMENNISSNGYGILLSYSNYSEILRNIVNTNINFGISLESSNNNEILENTANYNSHSGIRLVYSNINIITENFVNNNTFYGINLLRSDFNNINKNIIYYNEKYGIYLLNTKYNSITENTLNGNKEGSIKEENCEGNIIKDNNIEDGKVKSQFPLELIILFSVIGAIAIVVSAGTIIYKKRNSLPKKQKVADLEGKKREIEEKKKLKKYRKDEEEKLKIIRQKEKIEKKLRKRIQFVDYLIKENKITKAMRNLDEIQKIARSNELLEVITETEERIVEFKKLELETINRIKQTILNLGMKFTRLELSDISEKSGIQDEGLIEKMIQEMINNKEIHGEYFASSKALALEKIQSPVTREKEKQFNVFLSYSTLDTDYFEISRIVRRLELYPEISNVYFWETDSGENIVTFMEQTLKKTNVFVLFCSENSIKSKAVEGEWQAAFQLRKEGLMKIVPVYVREEHIPYLLKPILNVKFTEENFDEFILKLYQEILR